jgi:hypothetical protein
MRQTENSSHPGKDWSSGLFDANFIWKKEFLTVRELSENGTGYSDRE